MTKPHLYLGRFMNGFVGFLRNITVFMLSNVNRDKWLLDGHLLCAGGQEVLHGKHLVLCRGRPVVIHYLCKWEKVGNLL